MRILPVVMVRNEEYYIERVLRPLAQVFGHVVLADTGSTDRTVAIADGVPGVEVLLQGPQNAAGLTKTRQMLSRTVAARGYDWEMMVDGDELYTVDTLLAIVDAGMPEGKRAGFVTMLSVDRDEQGQLWEMADVFNRLCIHPAGVEWSGQYPFDVPVVFGDPAGFHYFQPPDSLRCHGLHLHRLQRSSHDANVWLRQEKQFRFSMQEVNVPRTIPLDAGYWGLS